MYWISIDIALRWSAGMPLLSDLQLASYIKQSDSNFLSRVHVEIGFVHLAAHTY